MNWKEIELNGIKRQREILTLWEQMVKNDILLSDAIKMALEKGFVLRVKFLDILSKSISNELQKQIKEQENG